MADESSSESEYGESERSDGVDSPRSLSDSENEPEPQSKSKEFKSKAKAKATRSYQCDHCVKICATPWGLKWHVAAKHKEESTQNQFLLDADTKNAMVVETIQAIHSEPVLGLVGERRKNVSSQLLESMQIKDSSNFVNSVCDAVFSVVKSSERVFSALKYEESLQRINAILNGKGIQLETMRDSLKLCLGQDTDISDTDIVDMLLSKICFKVFDKFQLELLCRRQQTPEGSETLVKPLQGDELQSFEEEVCRQLRMYHINGSMRLKVEGMKGRLLCLREKFALSVSDAELSSSDFVNEKMWRGSDSDIKISPMALQFFTRAEAMIRTLRNDANAFVTTDSLINLFLKEESQETMNLWFHLTAKHLSEKSAFGFMHSIVGQLLRNSNKTHVNLVKRKLESAKQLKKYL